MKPAKQCKDRLEDIVALVIGELDDTAVLELQEHLAVCEACRTTRDVLAQEEKDVRSGFEAMARSLRPIEPLAIDKGTVPFSSNENWESPQVLEEDRPSSVRVGVSNNHFLERVKNMIFTHKRLTAAVATLTALAAGLILCVSLISFSRSAYALEQTAQANNQIRSCHVRCSGGGVAELWMEMNPDGTPLRARMDFPKTEDGAKVVILSADRGEVWFKDKKSHVVLTEKKALAQIMKMQRQFDPKAAFETLQEMEKSGKAQVSTKEPVKEGEPIVLTVTSKDTPNDQSVYVVDPKTKLVERMTVYHRPHDGDWKEVGQIDYLDYNKPIDPKVFHLDLPKDVMMIDQINQTIGLEQGTLTKDEIAAKVAKEFFEALIAKDYAKAGLLLEGLPAEKMKEVFGRMKFQRIVEVGKPVAGVHPDPTALQVPVTVEVNGKKTSFKPFIRPVHGHPDRWDICGGI